MRVESEDNFNDSRKVGVGVSLFPINVIVM
jgi:hypothetical protein